MRYKAKPTITQLRRELVADSIERARTMEKLLKLVREDERQKTIADLAAGTDPLLFSVPADGS